VISISVSLTAHTSAIRRARQYERSSSFQMQLLLFLMNLFHICGRISAVSLFASLSLKYAGVVCTIHWVVMTLWLVLPISKSSFRVEKLINSLVLGTAYIFVFIHDENNRTIYKQLFYYTVCLVENTGMMVMWFNYGDFVSSRWIYSLFVGHYVLFSAGITLLITYYMKTRSNAHKDEYTVGIQLNDL